MKLGMKGFQMPGADMFWRHLSDECGFMSDYENLNIWNYNTEFDTKNVSLLYKCCIKDQRWNHSEQEITRMYACVMAILNSSIYYHSLIDHVPVSLHYM